jgi:hypothetical protein
MPRIPLLTGRQGLSGELPTYVPRDRDAGQATRRPRR